MALGTAAASAPPLAAIYNLAAEPSVLAVAGLLGFLLVAAMIPGAARAWGALGRGDHEISLRKIHRGEIPRVGGFVVILGFGLVLLLGLAGTTDLSATHELLARSPLTGVLVGALICGLTGLYDDLIGLRPRSKLLLQIAAAAAALALGLHWPALAALLGDAPWARGLQALITGGFLLAAVNAINLLDGLDGLAGGIVALGSAVVLGSALHHGHAALPLGWVAAATLGAVLGFLVHNRHPARVFMGDAGAYFLGFLLGGLLLCVEPTRERVPILVLAIPAMVLALPLFDLGLAIVRRAISGRPIFAGDCDHIHHRLLARGLSHPRAVAILWLSSGLYALLAYLMIVGVGGWWTLGGAVVSTLVVGVLLGYHNLLRRLPAFTGERLLGVGDRRRATLELLAAVDTLAAGEPPEAGDPKPRWRRLAPALAPILRRLGVPGFELRRGLDTVVRGGDDGEAWGWLSLPIPGPEDREAGKDRENSGTELRLALAVRLIELQPEQLLVIERIVTLLAGVPRASRRSAQSAHITKSALDRGESGKET